MSIELKLLKADEVQKDKNAVDLKLGQLRNYLDSEEFEGKDEDTQKVIHLLHSQMGAYSDALGRVLAVVSEDK